MTWLTWRQFRAQAITGAAVLAALAIALGITGPHLAHLYASSASTSPATRTREATSTIR